jgi:chromate transporter
MAGGTQPKATRSPVLTNQPLFLWSLFGIFFRIACTSFGGYMAAISVVENVIVERKKLLTHQDMLDGISLAQLLPGPVAVNVCAYVGYRLRGGAGAFISALAMILPGFVLIVILTYVYFTVGQIPVLTRLFQGFVPAVTAVILAAAWNMSRKAVTGMAEGAIMVTAAAALLFLKGLFVTVAVIAGAGIIGWFWFREKKPEPAPPTDAENLPEPKSGSGLSLFLFSAVQVAPFWNFDPGLVFKLFFAFGGMSLMLFGGGYVFIPMMQQAVVDTHGWVTNREFVDGIAMGQIMPGAILVSAAFIGFKVAGFAGALAATIGIFVPPAMVMVAASRMLERIKNSAHVHAALRGIRPAVVGMVAAAAWLVGQAAPPVWISAAIFALALVALVRFRTDAVWIIPPAGLLGVVVY